MLTLKRDTTFEWNDLVFTPGMDDFSAYFWQASNDKIDVKLQEHILIFQYKRWTATISLHVAEGKVSLQIDSDNPTDALTKVWKLYSNFKKSK